NRASNGVTTWAGAASLMRAPREFPWCPPPEADRGGRREAIDGELALSQANLQRVRPRPDRIIGSVTMREKMDHLIRRADPAPLRLRLIAPIRSIDQRVTVREQIGDRRFWQRPRLGQCVAGVNHYAQVQRPCSTCQLSCGRVSQRLPAQ